MFASERHSIILNCVNNSGAITVSELTKLLNVSGETLRRDLLYLENQKLLQRVHGGAISLTSTKRFTALSQRLNEYTDEKQQLSITASKFINEGDIIAIDCGSTSLALIDVIISRFKSLTIITNSESIFNRLKTKNGYKIYLIGGEYMESENAFYGPLAEKMLKNLHVSTSFIFPSAISLKFGVADFIPQLYSIQKIMMEIANKTVFLADSSKFEKSALLKLCDITENHIYITDNKIDENIYQMYLNNNIKLYKN